jgi:acyl-coenzyme A thioesterase PaaI-like protein
MTDPVTPRAGWPTSLANLLGTALAGEVRAEATLQHGGRTTQVWDAVVTHASTGRKLALLRCTQLVLHLA